MSAAAPGPSSRNLIFGTIRSVVCFGFFPPPAIASGSASILLFVCKGRQPNRHQSSDERETTQEQPELPNCRSEDVELEMKHFDLTRGRKKRTGPTLHVQSIASATQRETPLV